jgi:myo-inositol-1(or 4)-monophosphatase
VPPPRPIFLTTAIEAVVRAGELQMAQFGQAFRIDKKGATDLVTEVDLAVERMFRELIAQRFPDHQILAEEMGGAAVIPPGPCWVFDPIDGTTNYAHGVPIYCVSIALEVEDRIELGVAYKPSFDELYVAERGRGATVNDARLHVSTTATLDESLLATGFPYGIRETGDTNLPEYAAFGVRCRGLRGLGSAVLDLAWVATGRLDGLWALRLGSWDVAAGSLFVEEAGGRMTSLVGGPLDLNAPSMVATNGRIHEEMLAVLREIRKI